MPSLIRTARWTGGAYLALAVLGGLGFLLVRPLATESPATRSLASRSSSAW